MPKYMLGTWAFAGSCLLNVEKAANSEDPYEFRRLKRGSKSEPRFALRNFMTLKSWHKSLDPKPMLVSVPCHRGAGTLVPAPKGRPTASLPHPVVDV